MTDETRDRRTGSRRPAVDAGDAAWWLALCAPAVTPWVVVLTTSTTLVFPWGMVSAESWHLTTLPAYLESTAGLPRHLEMWPLGAGCYLLALAWAAGERVGADGRVTAGLLALAAVAAAWLATGLGADPHTRTLPLGSFVLLGAAAWAYGRA